MQRESILLGAAAVIAVVMLTPPLSPILGRGESSPVPSASGNRIPTPGIISGMERPLASPPVAKGVIVSGYSAGGTKLDELMKLVKRTELNTMVVDIKDETGTVSWIPKDPRARAMGGGEAKITDVPALVRKLHGADIWVIGRIVVFKDPVLSKVRPDLAVRDIDGSVWKDRKGMGWGSPYSSEVWEYAMSLAKEALSYGFDEIQFDYIRFPSDGDVSRIVHPQRDLRPPHQVIQELLRDARLQLHPLGGWVSADLFGFVTLVEDPGIGQRLALIADEVDWVSLMLYPSHYEAGNLGLKSPINSPYETVKRSLQDAKETIKGRRAKLRPWLQDFSILGVAYTPQEVRAEIKAAEEEGADGWLLWNANNRYSEFALRPDDWEKKQAEQG